MKSKWEKRRLLKAIQRARGLPCLSMAVAQRSTRDLVAHDVSWTMLQKWAITPYWTLQDYQQTDHLPLLKSTKQLGYLHWYWPTMVLALVIETTLWACTSLRLVLRPTCPKKTFNNIFFIIFIISYIYIYIYI